MTGWVKITTWISIIHTNEKAFNQWAAENYSGWCYVKLSDVITLIICFAPEELYEEDMDALMPEDKKEDHYDWWV